MFYLIVMTIEYDAPVFKNFGKDYQGREHFFTKQDEWKAKHMGKFVMSTLEDRVRVWALADAYTHSQVIGACKVQGYGGQILGGGSIVYSEEPKSISVSGRSGDFGGLPNIVLTDYFRYFWYSIDVHMNESWIKESTRQWFKEHGIDV